MVASFSKGYTSIFNMETQQRVLTLESSVDSSMYTSFKSLHSFLNLIKSITAVVTIRNAWIIKCGSAQTWGHIYFKTVAIVLTSTQSKQQNQTTEKTSHEELAPHGQVTFSVVYGNNKQGIVINLFENS